MYAFPTNTKLELATVPDGLTDLGHLIKQLTFRTQPKFFDMESEPTSTEAPVCTGTVPISASANTPPMSHPEENDKVAHAKEDPQASTDEVAHSIDGPDEGDMSTSPRSV